MNQTVDLTDIGKMFTATKPEDTMRIMSLCIDALTIARDELEGKNIKPLEEETVEKYYYTIDRRVLCEGDCPFKKDGSIIGSIACVTKCPELIEWDEKNAWIKCRKLPKGKETVTKET
jgi:hypothetical protein